MARWEVILIVRKLKEVKEEEGFQIGDYSNKKEAMNVYKDVSNVIEKTWPK